MKPSNGKLQQITNQPVYKALFYVLSVAFAGIIGNRADAIFIFLVRQVQPGFFPRGIWALFAPLIVAFPISIGFAAITALPLTLIIIRLQRAKRRRESMLEVDESVFRILKLSGYGEEQQEAFAGLIDALLKEALYLFGKDCKILVHRVGNPLKPRYLHLWFAKGVESHQLTEYQLTDYQLVTLEKKPINKSNLTATMKRFYIDRKFFVHEDSENNTKNVEILKVISLGRSLICCPIFKYGHEKDSDGKGILGVLTIMSDHQNAFSNSSVEAAQKIADRLASVMSIATRY